MKVIIGTSIVPTTIFIILFVILGILLTSLPHSVYAQTVENEIIEQTLETVEKATAGISEITESLNNASELIERSAQNTTESAANNAPQQATQIEDIPSNMGNATENAITDDGEKTSNKSFIETETTQTNIMEDTTTTTQPTQIIIQKDFLDTKEDNSSVTYLNYTNRNNGFIIQYPKDWSIDDTEFACSDSLSGKNVLTLSYDLNDLTNTNSRILFFIDNIKINSNLELSDYAFQRLNFYKDFGNIVEFNTNSKLGNETAYTVVLEKNPKTSITGTDVPSSSILAGEIGTLLDSKLYRITYTFEKIQKDNFIPILDNIINSFTTTNITDSQETNKTHLSWDSYNLKSGNNKFLIKYDINGLGNTLLDIKPLVSQADLLFKVKAHNDGYLLVEIPRKLLDSKLQNKTDYKFHISNDNKPNTPYEEINSNSNSRTLKIEIDDEDRIILIGGNKIDTGSRTIVNCNDIILFPVMEEQKENKIKDTSESLNETVNFVNEPTNNQDEINTFNISNNSSVAIKDEQQIGHSQVIIPESQSKSQAFHDQNIQAYNNKTSINKPSTEITMEIQLIKHELMDDWYQVSNFTFIASNTSKLCPSGNCEYELEGGEMPSEYTVGERSLTGKLKIDTGESKKVMNMRADWETVEERETVDGEAIQIIEGTLGIGRDEFNPEHKYQINGTLTTDDNGYLLEVTDIKSSTKDKIKSSDNCMVLPDGSNYCP